MNPIIPEQLIDRCCRHESAAQMELYSLLFRSAYGSSLRILRNASDAQEIVQESFLKIFKNIEKYRSGLPYVLRRITINASIDLLRKRRVVFVEFSPHEDIAEQDSESLETVEADVQAIKKAIEQLPTGYRLALTLRLIEDLSFEEIAHELGISASTARSQYARARQKTVEILRNNEYRRVN